MSWGIRIAAIYIGFVLMIAALIVRTAMENTDLESADYYERELRYQEQIDGTTAVLNSGVQPTIAISEGAVSVTLPGQLSVAPTGTVVFYRPDNAKLDRKFELNTASNSYPLDQFQVGIYRVRIDWTDNGQKYFYETPIYTP